MVVTATAMMIAILLHPYKSEIQGGQAACSVAAAELNVTAASAQVGIKNKP
jgi:hypothetical protein